MNRIDDYCKEFIMTLEGWGSISKMPNGWDTLLLPTISNNNVRYKIPVIGNYETKYLKNITYTEAIKKEYFPDAYPYLNDGYLTIGWNFKTNPKTNLPIKDTDKMTWDEGVILLEYKLNKLAGSMMNFLEGINLNQDEFNALISLAYDYGPDTFDVNGKDAVLVDITRSLNNDKISGQRYSTRDLIKKKTYKNKRRQREAELFMSEGPYATRRNILKYV